MVSKRLLEDTLDCFKNDGLQIKSVKYTKDLFPTLFEKFNNFSMEEESYCCYGLERHCWVEVVEKGVWGLTLEEVKRNILNNIKRSKKYLYNGKKYGGNRLHIYETEYDCYVFIYLRDILGVDYNIWFNNTKDCNDSLNCIIKEMD